MKKQKILDALAELFDADKKRQRKEKKHLKQLLDELKKKEKTYKKKLESEQGSNARDQLKNEIDVIHTQRKKGVKLLKRLK